MRGLSLTVFFFILLQSLEKAEMDMDRDLAARAEESRLASELKEQWQQKMKVL